MRALTMKKTTQHPKTKTNPQDPRKHPKPGYDEKNPKNKKDIQENPGDQNTG